MDLTTLIFSMVILGVTGLIAAILLYVVSQIFKVEEDPRIDLVQAVLPGANCGGCGFAGCRNFAEACVKAGSTEGLSCPVGGDAITEEISKILTPAEGAAAAPVAGEQVVRKTDLGIIIPNFNAEVAAKIKQLPTPGACYPTLLRMAQQHK